MSWWGGAPGARAEEEPPFGIITDIGGAVVVEVDRHDAGPTLDRMIVAEPMRGYRLERVYTSHATSTWPSSDPLAANQWNLDRIGLGSAWARTTGSGIVVAVVDSPINFGGSDGFCGPIVHPYDAQRNTTTLPPLNIEAPFGHGTHVAGTVAQCTDNGIGVAGIAPGASLMPVMVLDALGVGTSSDLRRGIDWAVDHGADVINLSLGAPCTEPWPSCSDLLVDAALARAATAGVLVVASSGNAASSFVSYPANHPDVLAVGAMDASDSVWNPVPGVGSNGGSALDLVAPGAGILQETTSFGVFGYGVGEGTSMAAPHVSGAAALLWAIDPGLSASEVAFAIRSSARDIGPTGYDTVSGWGVLDLAAAVEFIAPAPPPPPPCLVGGVCDVVARVDAGGEWGVWDALVASPGVNEFYFGNPGDVPFMGDWDGDGVATPGLYRQSDGFVYVRDSNTQGVADVEFFFGNPGDVPLVGDFDGDGRDSVSIWRASQARVYVINELGADGGGLGAAEFSFGFGNPGDVPFVGDFDGDGVDTVGLYRESTGFVYFRNSLSTGNADLAFFYGNPGDQILAGDWDGDGDDTVAVYRPSSGRLYVSLDNAAGTADWDAWIGTYPWVITAHPG